MPRLKQVDWQFVDYEDNQPTLDLISKRPLCILGMLDEGSGAGAGKDETVLQTFHSTFKDPKKHKAYIIPKKSADRTFVLCHYAGEVVYTIEGWIEKNKDELSQDIMDLITKETQFANLARLCNHDIEKKADADAAAAAGKKKKGGGGKKKKTVSKTFGDSLVALMTKLRATEHHYIRCLKPNQTLKPGDWDNDFMFRQLAYSGTLEVTQIRKAGLNVRRPLKHFYFYYKICAEEPAALLAGSTQKERCTLLLDQTPLDKGQYRVGLTIVFLKSYELVDQLDKIREVKMIEYVINLQSFFRMIPPYKYFHKVKRAAGLVHARYRHLVVSETFRMLRLACVVTQRNWRKFKLLEIARKVRDKFREEDEQPDGEEEDAPEKMTPDKRREELIKKMSLVQIPPRKGSQWGGKVKKAGAKKVNTGTRRVAAPKYETNFEGWVLVVTSTPPAPEAPPPTIGADMAKQPTKKDLAAEAKREKTQRKASRVGRNAGSALPTKRYAVVAQGTLTLFDDNEFSKVISSYQLSSCTLKQSGKGVEVCRRSLGGVLPPEEPKEPTPDEKKKKAEADKAKAKRQASISGGAIAAAGARQASLSGGALAAAGEPAADGEAMVESSSIEKGKKDKKGKKKGKGKGKDEPADEVPEVPKDVPKISLIHHQRAAPAEDDCIIITEMTAEDRKLAGLPELSAVEHGDEAQAADGLTSNRALRMVPKALEGVEGAPAAAENGEEKDSKPAAMPAPKAEFNVTPDQAESNRWLGKLTAAQTEAQLVAKYKISRHLTASGADAADVVADVDQEAPATIKEGYLRKKDVTLMMGVKDAEIGEGFEEVDDIVFGAGNATEKSRRASTRRSSTRRKTMKREPTRGVRGEYGSRKSAARPGPNAAPLQTENRPAQFEVVGETVLRPWQIVYCVLTNDGLLRFYSNHHKYTAIGSIDINELVVEELEGLDEDFGLQQAADQAAAPPPKKKRSFWSKRTKVDDASHNKGTHNAVAHGMLVNVVQGKMFMLRAGTRAHKFASPNPTVADEWAQSLALTMVSRYQLAPIFPRTTVQVHLLDGSAAIDYKADDSSRCGDLLRYACKHLGLSQVSEWGLHEVWDHAGMKGGASERRVPKHEILMDRTLLGWELAHRKRVGMVAKASRYSYRLVLCKVALGAPMASPVPKESQLEYAQALADVTEGRFLSVAKEDLYDLAALAVVASMGKGATDESKREADGTEGVARTAMQGKAHKAQILSALSNDADLENDDERQKAFTERLAGNAEDFMPAGYHGANGEETPEEMEQKIQDSFAYLIDSKKTADHDMSRLRKCASPCRQHRLTCERTQLTCSP